MTRKGICGIMKYAKLFISISLQIILILGDSLEEIGKNFSPFRFLSFPNKSLEHDRKEN